MYIIKNRINQLIGSYETYSVYGHLEYVELTVSPLHIVTTVWSFYFLENQLTNIKHENIFIGKPTFSDLGEM